MDVNYCNTLIAVADDCPVTSSAVPTVRAGKKTIPLIQYEMLIKQPYKFTSAEVLFESNMRHKGITTKELKANWSELWDAFFSKPQPCLRASSLPKKYGWGIHCNEKGKVALLAMESTEYSQYMEGKSRGVKVLKAMRSRRSV